MGEPRLFVDGLSDAVLSDAVLSDDGLYRYDLWRRWGHGPLLGWVMLNPSTGDDATDDHTLRRCQHYARRDGWAGIVVRNLYAYRTPDPKVMVAAARRGVDVVGPENDEWLARLAGDRFGVRQIVVAYGAGPASRSAADAILLGERCAAVERILFAAGRPLYRMEPDPNRMAPGPRCPHPARLANACPIVPLSPVYA